MAVRNYVFGAGTPRGYLDQLEQVFLKRNRYYNALVEEERLRRTESFNLLKVIDPKLAEYETELARLDLAIDDAIDDIKRTNQQARSRVATKEQKAVVKQLCATRTVIRKENKALKAELYADEDVQARLEAVETDATARRKALRANSGLWWGNYIDIEASTEEFRAGAPPEFKRYDERNSWRIAAQIQNGIPVAKAFECTDTRLRIEVVNDWTEQSRAKPDSKRSMRRQKAIVWIRTGSTGKANRDPVWLKVPVILHREIPKGAMIKWAYLMRYQIGLNYRWEVMLALSGEDSVFAKPTAKHGVVGVDLGWRLVPEGLRVATWAGSDGRQGYLIIPKGELGRWEEIKRLQSHQDTMRDEFLPRLCQWVKDKGNQAPACLVEAQSFLHKLKSWKKIDQIVAAWGSQRVDGDEAMYQEAKACCRQWFHLHQWARHAEEQNIRWRQNFYRNWVAEMRRQYHTVVLEDVNWSTFYSRDCSKDTPVIQAARQQMRMASVGGLSEWARTNFAAGIKVDADYTTLRCNECNHVQDIQEWDPAHAINHVCQNCQVHWDQDINAAINLLRMGSISADLKPNPEPGSEADRVNAV